MSVSFARSHILLQHFHLLCLLVFDPQYSRLSYTHALQGEPIGIVPYRNPIPVEPSLSVHKKNSPLLVTEFSKDAEQKVIHKDTILCFLMSQICSAFLTPPQRSLKDT